MFRSIMGVVVAIAGCVGVVCGLHAQAERENAIPIRSDAGGLSTAGLALINGLVGANRSSFFVYRDADSGFNHGFPSGLFPAGVTRSKLGVDIDCVHDPAVPGACATDPQRMDTERGTVLRLTFGRLAPGEFAGLKIEAPEHFGAKGTGDGYDLRGATQLCFDALSPTPGLRVQFGVASHMSAFMSLPARWTSHCLDLRALGASRPGPPHPFPTVAESSQQPSKTASTCRHTSNV